MLTQYRIMRDRQTDRSFDSITAPLRSITWIVKEAFYVLFFFTLL